MDARKLIDALGAQAQHLKRSSTRCSPPPGCPRAHRRLTSRSGNTAQAQLKYLISSSDAFSRQPERLPLGLDTYFRMQAVDSTLASLTEGVRKYQNPALASIMQEVIAENSTNRGPACGSICRIWRRKKNKSFQVADREAQRCRAACSASRRPRPRRFSQP